MYAAAALQWQERRGGSILAPNALLRAATNERTRYTALHHITPHSNTNSDWEFSWLARNLAPVKNQKIHWASEPGSASLPGLNIQNRGQIRFARRGPGACSVSLSISYEVPEMLAPFASVSAAIIMGGMGATNIDYKGGDMMMKRGGQEGRRGGRQAGRGVERARGEGEAARRATLVCTPLISQRTIPPNRNAPYPLTRTQALTPVVEGIIGKDMERFREYAQAYARAANAAADATASAAPAQQQQQPGA